jgi:hypothetical protein
MKTWSKWDEVKIGVFFPIALVVGGLVGYALARGQERSSHGQAIYSREARR